MVTTEFSYRCRKPQPVMIICTIFSYANSKPWLKTMLLFLKREGGHRCNENLERREKAALNSPVFKILIREGGHTLFYKVFKFNFVYFISFEKWGGGHLKNYVSLRLMSVYCLTPFQCCVPGRRTT